ncbi:unnamed protein product [Schistosoma margrebowiei]|uniref:Uncharacterized protein n=1 Tax=Schistosoma margrebowiei TaxID=48269 RepID=A0A183MW38_9TREM|nr:unnamed protein product [Schistosoma margrebowiei]
METLLAQQAVAGSMVTGIPPHIFSLQPSTASSQIVHGNTNHPCKQISKKDFLHDIDQYKSINNDSNLCKISTGSVFTSKLTATTTAATTTTTTTKPSILPIPTISNILNSSIQYNSKSINSHYTNQRIQLISTINDEQDYKNQSFQSILDITKPTILSSLSSSQSNDNQLIDSNKLSLLWNQKFIENTFITYFNQILYEYNMNQLDHQNIDYFKPSISSSSSSSLLSSSFPSSSSSSSSSCTSAQLSSLLHNLYPLINNKLNQAHSHLNPPQDTFNVSTINVNNNNNNNGNDLYSLNNPFINQLTNDSSLLLQSYQQFLKNALHLNGSLFDPFNNDKKQCNLARSIDRDNCTAVNNNNNNSNDNSNSSNSNNNNGKSNSKELMSQSTSLTTDWTKWTSFNLLNTLNEIWKSQWNPMKLEESNLNENNPINKQNLNESIKHNNNNHDCTTYNDTMDTTDYQQISILENLKKFKFMNSNHWMNKDHSPRNNHLCNSNETEEIIKPLTDSITSIT